MYSKFYNPSFFLRVCLLIIMSGAISSCITNRRTVYFPDPTYNTRELTPIPNQQGVYRLQSRDVLSIKIKTMDKESSEYFNVQTGTSGFNLNQASVYLDGYSIDHNGNISLPEVGKIKVAGLTVEEAQQKVQQALSVYLKNSTVLVKLVSFKITLLGEVNRPGQYYIYNDQATVLEGLGLGGDLTGFGNRENVTLIRQTETGLGAVLINLRDPSILSSKFFYLQPNDVLYVQPLEAKNTRSNLGTLGFVFGAVSTTFLIINFIRNL